MKVENYNINNLLFRLISIKSERNKGNYEVADRIKNEIIKLGFRFSIPDTSKMNIANYFPLGDFRENLGFHIIDDEVTIYGCFGDRISGIDFCISTDKTNNKCKKCKYNGDTINCTGDNDWAKDELNKDSQSD